jgi:hypothetical protein
MGIVTCCGHPSRLWPRSTLLNLRDQERHSTASPEKLALWHGSISSLLYCSPHFPLLREVSPQSLTWILSENLAPAQQWHLPFMTTPLSSWTKPRPYLDESSSHHGHKGPDLHRGCTWNRPPRNTRVTTLPPFVTCSGHPPRCWPFSQMLNLRDQERHFTASPGKLAFWQGSISSLFTTQHHGILQTWYPFWNGYFMGFLWRSKKIA